MAIVQNPIIGRASKSAGGMVFSTSLGQNVMRAKPSSYNDKQSDGQLAQRGKMTALTRFVAGAKFLLAYLFIWSIPKNTKYSQAIKVLSPYLVAEEDSFLFPVSKTVVHLGSKQVTPDLTFTRSNGSLSFLFGPVMVSPFTGVTMRWAIVAFNSTLNQVATKIIEDTSAPMSASITGLTGWTSSDDISCICCLSCVEYPSEYSSVIFLERNSN